MGNDVELQIAEAEGELRRAMLTSDCDVLNELLDSDLIFTNHLGQCLGKEADLSAHKSGALRISRLDPSEEQIKVMSSNVAVVSVRVRLEGTYQDDPAGGEFRFTRVWARTPAGQWRVMAAHSGLIA